MKMDDLLKLIPAAYMEKAKEYLCYLVGVRGYYKDTMGKPGENDRGIYDDAMFLIGIGVFDSYNANTDPSKHQRSIAVLQPGVYLYAQGIHGISGSHPYPALRQASDVTVLRDGSTEPETDTAASRFWINIHKGGMYTTSSLGCQTIRPDQWAEFKDRVYGIMDANHQKKIPYILVEA